MGAVLANSKNRLMPKSVARPVDESLNPNHAGTPPVDTPDSMVDWMGRVNPGRVIADSPARMSALHRDQSSGASPRTCHRTCARCMGQSDHATTKGTYYCVGEGSAVVPGAKRRELVSRRLPPDWLNRLQAGTMNRSKAT